MTGFCTYSRQGPSKRTTTQVMDDLFGVPMSVGTICQSEKTTTEVIAEAVEEARDYIQEQSVAHLDETSWREGGKGAWLWVAVTSLVTVFLVRLSRGGQVARELLGEGFSGILVTDRYSGPYTNITVTRGKVAAYERSSALTNRIPSNGEAVNDVKSMAGIF